MEKYQKEYIKLLKEKFEVKYIRKATYKRTRDIVDDGILVELDSTMFTDVCIFLSNNIRGLYHKWSMELNSENLPKCVWLTSYMDTALEIDKGFFI